MKSKIVKNVLDKLVQYYYHIDTSALNVATVMSTIIKLDTKFLIIYINSNKCKYTYK